MLSLPAGFILCLTWSFCQILSRFPFDFRGHWRWITTLIQMKFFGENFIFEVRVFIKIKISSVTWFNVFKFCHFNSCQIMQRLFILCPKQCRHLWMVYKCCYPKIGDFGDQFWPLLKKWLAEFVVFLFYFQNLLTSLFIKSVYFILYFISMFNSFLLFFFWGLIGPVVVGVELLFTDFGRRRRPGAAPRWGGWGESGGVDTKQIQVTFLFKFKMVHKAAETACNINSAFGPGTANDYTVQWVKK